MCIKVLIIVVGGQSSISVKPDLKKKKKSIVLVSLAIRYHSPVGKVTEALHLTSQIVWQLPGHLIGLSVPVVVATRVIVPNLLPVSHLYTHYIMNNRKKII